VIENRTEASFQLELNEFSKFKESLLSRSNIRPTIVGNLPWKISAMSLWNSDKETFVLGIFLQCDIDKEIKNYSVNAAADLKLVNLKDLKNDKTLTIKSVFKPNENSWGFSPFITMDEIMNKNNGFYDETKDRVILEACLSLDFPHEKN